MPNNVTIPYEFKAPLESSTTYNIYVNGSSTYDFGYIDLDDGKEKSFGTSLSGYRTFNTPTAMDQDQVLKMNIKNTGGDGKTISVRVY